MFHVYDIAQLLCNPRSHVYDIAQQLDLIIEIGNDAIQ